MLPRDEAHFGERRTQSGSRTKARDVVPLRAMPLENFERNVELPALRMNRKGLQQPCEGVSKPRVMRQIS